MKFASTFLAAAASAALICAPEARTRPTWEIGVGGFVTYGPVYYGSSDSSFGGFPIGYFTYRGEHFSIMSNGLYDVDADNENPFELSVSVDLAGTSTARTGWASRRSTISARSAPALSSASTRMAAHG